MCTKWIILSLHGTSGSQVRQVFIIQFLIQKLKELKPTYIKSMQLNGEDMTYDAPNYAWTKVITTAADNTTN